MKKFALIICLLVLGVFLLSKRPKRIEEEFVDSKNLIPKAALVPTKNIEEATKPKNDSKNLSDNDLEPINILLRAEKYSEAKEALERIIAANPDRDDAEALIGEILMVEDNYPEAYRHFLAALRINVNNKDALINLAETVPSVEKSSPLAKNDAIKLLEEVEKEGGSLAAKIGLAKLDDLARGHRSAIEKLEAASHDDDLLVESTIEAGVVYSRIGDKKSAAKVFEENINRFKESGRPLPRDWADMRYNYALTLIDLKEFDKAREQIERLGAEMPNAETDWIKDEINAAEAK